MLFGLFGKKKVVKSADPWQFQTLRDYWEVVHFLEEHRKAGTQDKAMQKFFFETHKLYVRNIDRYVELIDQLDEVSGGIYSDPEVAKHCGLKLAEGMTLKKNVRKQAKAVRDFLNKINEK